MRKLLVIVDMQNDFITGALGTKEAREILPNVIELAKNFNGDIILTRDTHHDNYMDTQEGKKLPVLHCVKDTDGWQIAPELIKALNLADSHGILVHSTLYDAYLPTVTDTNQKFIVKEIIDKPTFGSIGLARYLEEHPDYEEITFCGVCTGICVISNAMIAKAIVPETPIKVVANACACVSPESHEAALNSMRTCQIDII